MRQRADVGGRNKSGHRAVFAHHLNTSESMIEKWETGANKPSGAALKLLSLVQKHGLQILA
ncbi:MAG: hypothetical protein WCC64_18535 [Aliidongia sp.]